MGKFSRLVFLVLAASACSLVSAADSVVRVASASSMRFVLEELLSEFKARGDSSVVQGVYGSSGNLYRQIVQGAPFDLFVSADDALIEKLVAENDKQHRLLGYGELVLYHNGAAADDLRAQLESSLRSGQLNGAGFRVAVANPAHAPYGRAAKQALTRLDLWERAQAHVVVAESVAQAAQFARSGAVEFALISRSLADSLGGQYVALDKQLYDPIPHRVVLLTESKSAAALLTFFATEAAASVLAGYGFTAQ